MLVAKLKLKLCGLIFLGITALIFSYPDSAQAASFYLSPAAGEYKVGQSFSVSVFASSKDQAINAVSGVFSVSGDKLEILGVSVSGTKVGLWVQEPSFSKSSSKINFEGIILNPGYTGAGAKIISINLKAKAAGKASINFNSGSILANDGEGTNVLSGGGGASFNITQDGEEKKASEIEKPAEDKAKPAPVIQGLAAPIIKLGGNAEANRWLNSKDLDFSWDLPEGVSAVYLLVGSKADSNPIVAYEPAIREKTIKNIDDGNWYLHARFKNAKGLGEIAHFPFNVDTINPSDLKINAKDNNPTDPRPTFNIEAKDDLSGISHYAVQIDDGQVENWTDDGSHAYKAPLTLAGHHTIKVKAYDKAGNFITASQDFEIKDISAPQIIEYTEGASAGDKIIIKGIASPGAQVTLILLDKEGKERTYNVQAQPDGQFVLVADSMPAGTYSLVAKAVDSLGAQSPESAAAKINVAAKKLAINEGTSRIITIIILLASLILIVLVAWLIASIKRHRNNSDDCSHHDQVSDLIESEFARLREETDKYLLDKGRGNIKSLAARLRIEEALNKLQGDTKRSLQQKIKKIKH